MRLLMLSQYFQPEPFFKALPFAKAMRDRGHHVEVLTGFPNYPGGRLYENYRLRPYQFETLEGIGVHRAPLYPSHDASALKRVMTFGTFACSATAVGMMRVTRPDVLYAYHPPGTIALPAVALKRWFGAPLVYDVQDVWPDSVVASGMAGGSLVSAVLTSLSGFTYRNADQIVTLGPRMRDVLVERGAPPEKVRYIYNWCDESGPLPDAASVTEARARAGWQAGEFVLLFAGNMGPLQDLETVLDVAAMQRADARVRFAFLGSGLAEASLRAQAHARGLANVQFLPRVSASEATPLLAAADALLVHLRSTPLLDATVPSKTQAYMRVGRPILMAAGGDGAALVGRAGCGVVATPGSPESLSSAVRDLANLSPDDRARLGRNGQDYYDAHLSLARGVAHFEELFQQVSGVQ